VLWDAAVELLDERVVGRHRTRGWRRWSWEEKGLQTREKQLNKNEKEDEEETWEKCSARRVVGKPLACSPPPTAS